MKKILQKYLQHNVIEALKYCVDPNSNYFYSFYMKGQQVYLTGREMIHGGEKKRKVLIHKSVVSFWIPLIL